MMLYKKNHSKKSFEETLVDEITKKEQAKLKEDLGLQEILLPLDCPLKTRCNIFVSPNASRSSHLIMIITNGRGLRPGIWSRSLSLEEAKNGPVYFGSMFSYVSRALKQGYAVLICNPNMNYTMIDSVKCAIPGSHTPDEHVVYVWRNLIYPKTKASIYILAYGNGGELAKYLISKESTLRQRLIAIAFIESNHSIKPNDNDETRQLIRTRSINWRRSSLPFGAQLSEHYSRMGCLSLSAGEPTKDLESSNAAWTIYASMDTVFCFFQSARCTLQSKSSPSSIRSSNTVTVPEEYQLEHDDEMEYEYDNEDRSSDVTMGEPDYRCSCSMVISNTITAKDFDMLSVVGKGAYGKVLLVRKNIGKNKGRIYAMKILKKEDVSRQRQIEHTKSERRILRYVEYPFIVRLRYAFQSQHKLYLVTDYYPGGSLFVHLRREKRFSENKARFYACELLLAISHLHNLHILYRDLKLENILMDAAGHIAITDFGLSKENDYGNTFVGTPEYLAPEILKSQNTASGYGKSVDWWSYAVLIYEMIAGETPFYSKNRREMFQNILTLSPRFDPALFSPLARHFLSGLLMKDPNSRLGCGSFGITELMNHPWFYNINWKLMLEKHYLPPYQPTFNPTEDLLSYIPHTFRELQITESPLSSHTSNLRFFERVIC